MCIGDLFTKMEESAPEDKIITKLWENIIVSGGKEKSDIVTLRETANEILRSYHQKSKYCDIEPSKIHLIEDAARIGVRSDVKSLQLMSTHHLMTSRSRGLWITFLNVVPNYIMWHKPVTQWHSDYIRKRPFK